MKGEQSSLLSELENVIEESEIFLDPANAISLAADKIGLKVPMNIMKYFNELEGKISKNEIESIASLMRVSVPESKEKLIESIKRTRIAYKNFQIDDLVLLLPTRSGQLWGVFNDACPHFYLSEECFNTLKNELNAHYKRQWALGRIMQADRKISDGTNTLPQGLEFHEIKVDFHL